MTATNGKMTITTRFKRNPETTTEETISVKVYPPEVALATVSVEGSVTKNLGNYESLRIQASITLPCAVEETDSAYAEAWRRVEAQLSRKVAEVLS